MPQLGLQELIFIFIVALLVFGPKKLPDLGKSLGKGMREFRKATNELKASWEDQIRDTEQPFQEVKQTMNDVSKDFRDTFDPADQKADSLPSDNTIQPHEDSTVATQEAKKDGSPN
jgi:TatA/E family protein of Tat protein translocase